MPHRLDGTFYESEYRIENRVQQSEGTLYRKLTQPNEHAILQRNAELRKDSALTKRMEIHGQRYVGEIPKARLWKWQREDPDMTSPDPQIRRAAMIRHLLEEYDCMTVPRSFLQKPKRKQYARIET